MRKTVSIVGGGICAIILGCELDPEKFEVSIYEKNTTLGRKFLVAGDGGLNLTHSENETQFLQRYTPHSFLEKALSHFSNLDLIQWLKNLGIETYVGSSGRLFPEKGIKPIEVLNALLEKLKCNHVVLNTKHEWIGFSKTNDLLFNFNDESKQIKSDYVIFCIGGASWPVTGSTGNWKKYFSEKNITAPDFLASNCSFKVDWPEAFISKAEGKILKNVNIRCADKIHAGEVVITRFGMEGSGIYPLSPQIRKQLLETGKAEITIDFKPSVSLERLVEKLKNKKSKTNFTEHLKTQLNLSDAQLMLLKQFLSKKDFLNPEILCSHIKNFSLSIEGLGPIEAAISTVGGIALSEIDPDFQLKKIPQHFVIGEMLDYDAPTGGYLLQSCFSMGKFVADHLNALSFQDKK